MLQGLAERERNIAHAQAEAEKARAGAAQLQHQLETERLKAATEIREKFEEARKRAEELADEFRTQARAEIAADRERLHREVETSRTQALHEVWTQTAQLAALSATKILKREINPDDQKQLVDEALVEFRRSLSERQQQMTGLQA
jgi:F-type H+-transporting ATPase subunit b